MNLKSVLVASATVLGATALSVPAQAALVSVSLDYTYLTGDSSLSSGTGFFVIDDSLLTPNQFINDVNALSDFSLTFTSLSTVPSPVTFGLSDIVNFILETDANGDIGGVTNFAVSNTNYDLFPSGTAEAVLATSSGTPSLTTYGIEFGEPTAVPEPATVLGLLVVGGVGLLTKRQKQA